MDRPTVAASEPHDVRETILQESGRLFVARGYHGLAMRELAEAVGVSKAALYYHFTDKEDLFMAVLTSNLDRIEQVINEARKARTRGKERPRDRFVFKRSEIERDFAAAGLEMIGHADFIRYWDKWRAYVLRVKK